MVCYDINIFIGFKDSKVLLYQARHRLRELISTDIVTKRTCQNPGLNYPGKVGRRRDGADVLPEEKFGFRRGWGTVLQVARISYDIKENCQKRVNTNLTSLDMAKTFDGIWYETFVAKLFEYRMSLWLMKMIL